MKDLEKITLVVDRFTSQDHFAKVSKRNIGFISIEIALALGEYQAKHGNLDLDGMLASDDRYSVAHDIMGIWNGDNFTPRFTKH